MAGKKGGTCDIQQREKHEEEGQEDEIKLDEEFLVAATAQWAQGQGGEAEQRKCTPIKGCHHS